MKRMSVAVAGLMAFVVLGVQPQAARDLVDLRRIGHIESKGRIQDSPPPVVEKLIKIGPAAVPFLISKLEDATRIPRPSVLDFWPRVDVSHVALLVLCDLFTRADGTTSTVPGLNWGNVIGHDPDLPAWESYEDFVAKHGRAAIRLKVERLLAPHRDAIVWDPTERCFKPRT